MLRHTLQKRKKEKKYQTKLGTGDVTPEITEDDWEQGWSGPLFLEFNSIHAEKILAFEEDSNYRGIASLNLVNS